MAAIITEKFRLHNASQFVESFSETAANVYYLFLGKSSPFSSATSLASINIFLPYIVIAAEIYTLYKLNKGLPTFP